jgi:hypothetical protein
VQSRSVLIEVSPSELRCALVSRGRITAMRTAAHWDPDWRESWPGAFEQQLPRLRSLVSELGAAGLEAITFYTSSKSACGIFSCPASAGGSAAESAAKLALADGAEFAPGANPTLLLRLATDRAGNDPPQIHTLGATDTEASVSALAGLVAGAGLRFGGAVPAEAVALAATVRAAMNASAKQGTAVALRIGSWGCTLAAATGGRLRFARSINVGTAALVTALSGHGRADSSEAAPDRAAAGDLLVAAGIPARGQIVDARTGLMAEAVLPLMQPILQRCIVEIKQSLRFGLTEAERAGARLITTGPGSLLPNLGSLIAEQCGLTLAGPDAPATGSPLSGGEIEDFAAGALRGAELLFPAPAAIERRLRGIRRGMWIGVGAACALGAVDGVSAWFELGSAAVERDRARTALAESSKVVEIGRALAQSEGAINASRQRLAARMGPHVRWDALLGILASSTPEAIRLTKVEMRLDNSGPQCTLWGRALASEGGDPTSALRAYIERISASPIMQRCSLVSARRTGEGDGGGQEFEVAVTLLGLPSDHGLAQVSAGEGRP